MTDVHTKEKRSFNMSRIKGKDTKPEIIVRRWLFSKGFRYRVHDKKLIGSPDIVLSRFRTVVFVHGCFWHGHDNCKQFVLPKTRTDWWNRKIVNNKEKDMRVIKVLENEDWNVIVIWGCELTAKKRVRTMEDLVKRIQSQLVH